MGRHYDDWFDDEKVQKFPCLLFWIIHVMGGMLIFFMGMKFAMRRYSVFKLFKLLRMLTR